MNNTTESLHILEEDKPIFQKYLPIISRHRSNGKQVNEWDIPYTIQELSYLVHSHYRYYGKFPSVAAGQILEQFHPPTHDHYVLDNFCGSGTTLVEAKLRGIRSFGLDISWLSVLASNVKVTKVNTKDIKNELFKLVVSFEKNKYTFEAPDDSFAAKWFDLTAARDLTVIQHYLYKLKKSEIRDFLVVAFIGVVRRVSKAHDGEVRPHINKKKKQRDVISALSKKVNDMCEDHNAFQAHLQVDTESQCFLGNNLSLPQRFTDGKCYLVISHPPYLNSFNYAPVFSLEFYWGDIFEEQYTNGNEQLYKTEMKAHPANESVTDQYFEHLKKCYKETYRLQEEGSYLAIVIGDCTRNKQLIPVIDRTIDIVEDVGYKVRELNYRTTHYGLGKYAYSHRADYHGNHEEKKDGIIIFKK